MSTEPKTRRAAVALEYDAAQTEAPRVVAKGRGPAAEEIIRLARSAGVPVREDPALVELLGKLDVGDLVPPELYVAVAEVLAYLYRLSLLVPKVSSPSGAPRPPGVRQVTARPSTDSPPGGPTGSSGPSRSREQHR